MSSADVKLGGVDRRLVVGSAVILACTVGVFGSYNFVVNPISSDLNATQGQSLLLRELPSIGTLVVVFIVGLLGTRLGMKRVIVASAVIMTLGYVLVMLGATVIAVIFGMLMGSIGKQGIAVVTVSLIATHLTSDANRATGFAALGMASPFGYVVTPIAAGLLLDATNWRVAVGLWVFVAVVATVAALMLLPPDGPRERAGELWTPALAGLVLVGVVQCIRLVNLEGLTAPRTLIWLAIALISLLALWQLMVRLHEPTLDLAILKKGSAVLLLVVIMLLSFTNLCYYFSIGVQRVYGLSATQVALLLVPCQLAGIAGAWIAGRGIKRRGLRVVGTLMLLGVSAALLLTVTQHVDTFVIVPTLILCLFAFASIGGGVVMTNAFMNLAPPGRAGSASAFRGAASSVGVATGVAFSAIVFFGTTQTTFHDLITRNKGDVTLANKIADRLHDATSTREEVATAYSLPLKVVTDYDKELLAAQVTGYRAQGLLGGFLALAAAILFFFVQGRRSVGTGDAPKSTTPTR